LPRDRDREQEIGGIVDRRLCVAFNAPQVTTRSRLLRGAHSRRFLRLAAPHTRWVRVREALRSARSRARPLPARPFVRRAIGAGANIAQSDAAFAGRRPGSVAELQIGKAKSLASIAIVESSFSNSLSPPITSWRKTDGCTRCSSSQARIADITSARSALGKETMTVCIAASLEKREGVIMRAAASRRSADASCPAHGIGWSTCLSIGSLPHQSQRWLSCRLGQHSGSRTRSHFRPVLLGRSLRPGRAHRQMAGTSQVIALEVIDAETALLDVIQDRQPRVHGCRCLIFDNFDKVRRRSENQLLKVGARERLLPEALVRRAPARCGGSSRRFQRVQRHEQPGGRLRLRNWRGGGALELEWAPTRTKGPSWL